MDGRVDREPPYLNLSEISLHVSLSEDSHGRSVSTWYIGMSLAGASNVSPYYSILMSYKTDFCRSFRC